MKYNSVKIKEPGNFRTEDFWDGIPSLKVDNYLWMDNGYNPMVKGNLCYSNNFLFVRFRAYEKEITATYTKINSPVCKDSCVEFFINLFPNKTDKYFNFEINPIGTIHVGFGAGRSRSVLPLQDIKKIEIASNFTKPITGVHGKEFWEISYKIPTALFEKHYKLNCKPTAAKGNFYKCGDETKYEHYAAWNRIISDKPNFHLPQFFGDIIFV